MDMKANANTPLLERPFEGSEKAADLIARITEFLTGELAELAQAQGIDHEHSPSRETLRSVWQRSRELGF